MEILMMTAVSRATAPVLMVEERKHMMRKIQRYTRFFSA